MPRKGIVDVSSTFLFPTIQRVCKMQNPKKLEAWLKHSCGLLSWGSYPFVLIHVSGRYLLELQGSWECPTARPDAVVLAWWVVTIPEMCLKFWSDLVHERKQQANTLLTAPWKRYVMHTKPLQSNIVDCGLYVLHCIDKISRYITELRRSLQALRCMREKMEQSTCGSFNVAATDNLRTKLHDQIVKNAGKINERANQPEVN